MADLKKDADKGRGRPKRFPPQGINIDIELFGSNLTIMNHDVPGQTFNIEIPEDSINAFMDEMKTDKEFGKFVVLYKPDNF